VRVPTAFPTLVSSCPYSPEGVEEKFSEVRVLEILRCIAVARCRVRLNGI
jgi:hypothetical protein